MLELLYEKDLPKIEKFCEGKILGTRIACYAECYGFNRNFLMFWGSKTAEGFNCIAARFDNTLTVLASEGCEFEELNEFINVIGAETVIINYEYADKLKFSENDVKIGFKYKGSGVNPITENASETDLKEIYNLISTEIPFSFEKSENAYLSFLSDFTFRQRRGFAEAKCIHKDGRVVSSCLTSAQSKTDALLSGVACDSDYRMYGYGKQTVLSLAEELRNKNKNVFVIALNSSAEGFYEHIGFKECEKIAFIKER